MYFQKSVDPVESRGFSSTEGTNYLVSQLPVLFKKHNITSMFDAGANDCAWQVQTIANIIRYSAGDHNPIVVDLAKKLGVDAVVHDVRIDLFPQVDMIFIRDVAIHLNKHYKTLMLKNWLQSNVPWLLMTQIDCVKDNQDFEHKPGEFPFAEVNWNIAPWNFPKPTDSVVDLWPGSCRLMCLWHRDQIKDLL